MNANQQAALQGVLQGAETAAAVGVGVASIADPRVGAAVQLSMSLMDTAQKMNQISQSAMSDKELLQMWAVQGSRMARLHDEIFGADASVDTDPNVIANEAAAALAADPPATTAATPATSGSAS